MKPTNYNLIKIYRSGTHRSNRTRLNATVFIIALASILWACYLTDKGYKKCLQAGQHTELECVKLHYG